MSFKENRYIRLYMTRKRKKRKEITTISGKEKELEYETD